MSPVVAFEDKQVWFAGRDRVLARAAVGCAVRIAWMAIHKVDYTGSVGAGLLDDGMGPREILVAIGHRSRRLTPSSMDSR